MGQARSTCFQFVQQSANIRQRRWRNREKGLGQGRKKREEGCLEVGMLGGLGEEVRVEQQFQQTQTWPAFPRSKSTGIQKSRNVDYEPLILKCLAVFTLLAIEKHR